jgi:hypothetical protein
MWVQSSSQGKQLDRRESRMFGNKKKRNILENGAQAQAIVIGVRDTGVTINENPRVELTLQVQPEGAAPFEAKKKVTVSRVSIPRAGDGYWVRYDPADPTEIEFDTDKLAEVNEAAEASVAEAAASQVPADLGQNGILGRGALVSVDKAPMGTLVDCTLAVGVRLVDGTPSYRAQTRVSLSPENAEKLIPGQTLFTVRADPNNHERRRAAASQATGDRATGVDGRLGRRARRCGWRRGRLGRSTAARGRP